jgi:predicted CXXCH cytochrome family protein
MRLSPRLTTALTAAKSLIVLSLLALLVGASTFDDRRARAAVGAQDPAQASPPQQPRDPAAWGSNHVGQPVPEYVHGDECLFCHRNDIGATWQKNAHGLTVRQREDAPELLGTIKGSPALAELDSQIEYFLGSRHRVRFLKKDGYGQFAILSTQAVLGDNARPERWLEADKPAWDREKVANRCTGCHNTAVDPATKAFSAFGLDCYACHGNVDLEHSKDTSLVWLSKKRRHDAQAITSICAQCHLREGKARSTGLPYPNNFIAGDNLFQDYTVDFTRADDESLNAGDRHVLRSVREVVLYGSEVTCLNCHQVHANSSQRHRRALRAPICFDCHYTDKPFKEIKPYTVKSALCEY